MPVLSPIARPYPASSIESSATALHIAHCAEALTTDSIMTKAVRQNIAEYFPIFLSMAQRYKMENQMGWLTNVDLRG